MKALHEQLHDAMVKKGWSIPRLLDESGLECDRSSLQRKLTGLQKLATEEAERLAKVLECPLAWIPEEKAS